MSDQPESKPAEPRQAVDGMFIVIGTCPHCGHATVCDPAWLQLIRSEGKGFANIGDCGDCDQCGFANMNTTSALLSYYEHRQHNISGIQYLR